MRTALQKTIERKVLKFEDFRTLICEVGAIVNSRPLTYIYDELGTSTIRSMDFLQTGSLTGFVPVGTFDDPDYIPSQESKDLVSLCKKNLTLTDAYWEAFKEEYLLSLREHQTMLHHGDQQRLQTVPKVGDIVFVKEIDLRRWEWKTARVEAVNKRRGGYTKGVTVILSNHNELSGLSACCIL